LEFGFFVSGSENDHPHAFHKFELAGLTRPERVSHPVTAKLESLDIREDNE
jgi:hypothetical protein